MRSSGVSDGRAAGDVAPAAGRGAVWLLAALAALGACETGGAHGTEQGAKGNQVLEAPILELTPPDPVIQVPVSGPPGALSTQVVRLINTGTSLLDVHEVSVHSVAKPDDAQPVFRLSQVQAVCNDPAPCTAWVWEPGAGPTPDLRIRSASQGPVAGADYALISVTYARPGGSEARTATLEIRSNALQGGVRTVTFVAQPGVPVLEVSPREVRLEAAALWRPVSVPVTVTNVGSDTLRIASLDLFGSADFRVSIAGEELGVQANFVPAEPPQLPPGWSATLQVSYTPSSLDTASGALIIRSNDPSLPEGTEIALIGALSAPCLSASPPALDFGPRPVGLAASRTVSIQSCGTDPVTITRLATSPGTSPSFTVDDADVEPAEALVLPVGGAMDLDVTFTPQSPATVTLDGVLVEETGALVVESDSMAGTVQVGLSGAGVPLACPIAVAQVVGDPIVLSGTAVKLRGDQSFAPAGPVAAWQWTVEQPVGSAVLLLPAATTTNPTVELDVVGAYRFGLVIWDEAGTRSCWTAFASAEVVAEKGLQVELVWDTPGDPDQTDIGSGAGADLDLHTVHPLGYAFGDDVTGDGLGDGWFGVPYDCFWGNPRPDWGSTHPLAHDDPSLDRDDADGAGPEVLTLPAPQASALYRIGVHVFDDHGAGPSLATVRVYLDGKLAWEGAASLKDGELWDAAWVAWSGRQVKGITDGAGAKVIIPDYPVPPGWVAP